jgi:hypothetical protein
MHSARYFLGLLALCPLATIPLQGQTPDSDQWATLGAVLGAKPVVQPGVHRFNFPRSDLTVRMGEITIAPALALTSWAAFTDDTSSMTVMGDLVVIAPELPGLLAALSSAGIAVTAVHNHLVGEDPRVMYVHYHGHGASQELAAGLAHALAATATPRPATASPSMPVTIDTARIHAALQSEPKGNGTIASVAVPLLKPDIMIDGHMVPVTLGLTSPINFQWVSDQRWLATGDFAVTSVRVQPIVRALIEAGITPTAIHSHLVGETPTVYFIHFWADGTPTKVLSGLGAAVKAAGQ